MQLNPQTEQFYFGKEAINALNDFFQKLSIDETHFLLLDSNTLEHCYSKLSYQLNLPDNIEILEVIPGENTKQIEIAKQLVETMLYYQASRKSKLITLGGGCNY